MYHNLVYQIQLRKYLYRTQQLSIYQLMHLVFDRQVLEKQLYTYCQRNINSVQQVQQRILMQNQFDYLQIQLQTLHLVLLFPQMIKRLGKWLIEIKLPQRFAYRKRNVLQLQRLVDQLKFRLDPVKLLLHLRIKQVIDTNFHQLLKMLNNLDYLILQNRYHLNCLFHRDQLKYHQYLRSCLQQLRIHYC